MIKNGRIRSWKCKFCSKKYKHQSSASRHSRICPQHKRHFCKVCGKGYKHRSGLSRHFRAHSIGQEDEARQIGKELQMLRKEVVAGREELAALKRAQIAKGRVGQRPISINVYLNNYCMEALRLNEFIEEMSLDINDLLRTGELGYVKGISTIFVSNLECLSDRERPIHCTDKRRLKFYVKGGEGWVKDEGGRLDKAITKVEKKQIDILLAWQMQNPDYLDNIQKSHVWQKLIKNTMGGIDEEERERNRTLIKQQVGKRIGMERNLVECGASPLPYLQLSGKLIR